MPEIILLVYIYPCLYDHAVNRYPKSNMLYDSRGDIGSFSGDRAAV